MEQLNDCLTAIRRIVELSNLSRKEGLLALEGLVKSYGDPFLTELILLITDGADYELISSMGEGYIAYIAGFEKPSPHELLRLRVILNGVLRITNGENPRNIECVLSALCGILKAGGITDEWIEENMPEESALAEEILRGMDAYDNLVSLQDRDIQLLLRCPEFNDRDLAVALRSGNKNLRDLFLGNVSARKAAVLKESMVNTAQLYKLDAENAWEKITGVLKQLQAEGCIFAVRN